MWKRYSAWCAGLRPNAPPCPRRRPRSNDCGSSYRSYSAASLVGAPNGSMTTSCNSALRTSAPTSREPKPRCRQWPSNHQRPGRRLIDQACQRICLAKRCGSISSIGPVPAAVDHCMLSARPSARCSIMFRRGFGLSASADRDMAAGPAGPFTKPLLRSVRSPKASPVPVFWLTSLSQSTAITFRFIGRAKSSHDRASSWIARRSPTGLAAPSGGWSRCRQGSPNMSSPRTRCSLTTPRSRCSIPAVAAPRPAASGFTRVMIGPGMDPIHRRPLQSRSPVRAPRCSFGEIQRRRSG
jgi:hypothetical protein